MGCSRITCERFTVSPWSVHASAMSRAETEPYRPPDSPAWRMITTDRPTHPLGQALRLFAALDVLRFKLGALLIEMREIAFVGAQRLLLRQKEVAGVTRLHLHHVAHLPQVFDPLEQDQFNGCHDCAPYATM